MGNHVALVNSEIALSDVNFNNLYWMSDPTFHLLKFSEIWAQAKSLFSSTNWKPARRGAWEVKSSHKAKWLCRRTLPSKGSEADWCKNKWHYEKRLAHFKRIVV